MPVRLLLFSFAVSTLLAQPAQQLEVAVQESLSKLLQMVRTAEAPNWTRLLAPTADKIRTPALLRELGLRLRPTSDRPMSELSAPILLVSRVSLQTPERAGACVSVMRFGSVVNETLAVYDLTAIRIGKEWRIGSLVSTGTCRYSLVQLADAPEKQLQAP